MLTNQEIKKRIEKCEKLGWWYQPMIYRDIKVKCRLAGPQVNPISYGKGKFNNYIKPHLNFVDWKDKFCEIGTNSGLFLVEAAKLGFNEVIGIEGSELFIEQLKLTKDVYNDINMRIYYNRLGNLEKSHGDNKCNILNLDDMPIVSVTVICNFHYWIEENVFDKYINELSSKSEYVIIVTEENLSRVVNSSSNLLVDKMKQKWDVINTIKTGSDILNNSSKRTRNLTSILFKSKLKSKKLTFELHDKQKNLDRDTYKLFCGNDCLWNKFYNKYINFIEELTLNEINNMELYKFSINWRPTWGREKHTKNMFRYVDFIKDITKYGQKSCIVLLKNALNIIDDQRFYDPFDGHHRVATLNLLNIKYTYCKEQK